MIHSDRRLQLDDHLDVITRHDHLNSLWKLDLSGHVSGPEVELRLVSFEEWRVPSSLVFREDIDLSFEFRVRSDGSWLRKNLSSLYIRPFDTSQEQTCVVSGLTLLKLLVEHLDSGDGRLPRILDSDDFNFVSDLDDSLFDLSSNDGSSSFDGEDVFDWHEEWLIESPFRNWYEFLDLFEELEDRLRSEFLFEIRRILKSDQSGSSDDRSIVSREVVLGEELPGLHLDEILHVSIRHVAFVHVDDDVRDTDLPCEEDVLPCLSHRSVRSGYDEDGGIHLSCTGDHVLDVVSMSWAVNVSIVPSGRLILDVSGIDGDTSRPLFRSVIDLRVILHFSCTEFLIQNICDRGGSRGLPVIYVSDGTYIQVWLGAVKNCHIYKNINE